jgi:hypothetical protein
MLAAPGLLSTAGNWTMVLVADVVLLIAVLQSLGLRRSPVAARTLAT